MKTRFHHALVICIAAVFAGHGPAAAQPASPQGPAPGGQNPASGPGSSSESERPWAKGVSPEDQKEALRLFYEGNAMLKDSLFVPAAAKYREALSHWDHPAIHYNLALALANLDQPLEVYQSLEKAISYGPAPLDGEKYEHASSYKALIEKQLARAEITCDIEGAEVSLDGKPLFVAPGKWEGYLRASNHTVTARATGYIETSLTRTLPAGKVTQVPVRLYTDVQLTRYRRHWAVWKPWAVTGGSALALAAGAALHLTAKGDIESFDRAIRACGDIGCVPEGSLLAGKNRAGTLQGTAVALYAIGGAALATGLTLVYINRSQPYRLKVDELERELRVAPVIAPNQAGFVASFRF